MLNVGDEHKCLTRSSAEDTAHPRSQYSSSILSIHNRLQHVFETVVADFECSIWVMSTNVQSNQVKKLPKA
jgi:hypothetical protein